MTAASVLSNANKHSGPFPVHLSIFYRQNSNAGMQLILPCGYCVRQ